MKLSIIIPVYHEREKVCSCLERLLVPISVQTQNLEIIVVDGAQEGDTVEAVQAWMAKDAVENNFDSRCLVLKKSASGRGAQMNYGASCASGDVLLFLHVDTILPDNYLKLLEKAFDDGHQVGAFSLAIDDARPWFRVVEYVANKRNTWTKTPYGDQAQFFMRAFFLEIGGYAEIPLMEDVDIMRRVRRAQIPLCLLPESATTSARRWHEEGLLYCSLRNVVLRTLYAFGASSTRLAKWYSFAKRHKVRKNHAKL